MTFFLRARTLVTATVLVLAGTQFAPAASPAGSRGTTTLTLTAPVRAALRKVRIPVLVPTVVPTSLEVVGIAVDSYSDDEYSLELVASQACVGVKTSGGACTQASVEGQRTAGPTPSGYRPVTLSDGSKGYYLDGPCGMNCHGSFQFTFVRGGVRYTIVINAGKLAQALTIERGLRVLR